MKDKPWWNLETNGQFTVKSAWQYIRKKREESKLYKFFWVKGLPFKVSFFMWRLWIAKLPLDDWILRLGYCRASTCWSCRNPKEEMLPRVFLTSLAARSVWNYFGAPAGFKTQGKQLVQLINEWWNKLGNTGLKAVYQALSSLIVWHLWKNRNSGMHGKYVSINRLIIQISTSIQMLLKVRRPGIKGVTANWPDLHDKGGIGDLIYAQQDAVEDATNNIAVAQAILEALRYIIPMQFPPCIIETDSLLMKNMLDEIWEPPWSIANQVDEIKTLLSRGVLHIVHELREGNKLADHLANLTLDQQHIQQVLDDMEDEEEIILVKRRRRYYGERRQEIGDRDDMTLPTQILREERRKDVFSNMFVNFAGTLEEVWLYVLAKPI
ncbi:uncharacterized protein LOC142175292 [Nicotiana tabacum]|uniref:Uncharacterized protein LOC142175292 n=1 Tax=Nicotiana tabacum TaxID=4097 RepID=A0AC58TL95_TOBAC